MIFSKLKKEDSYILSFFLLKIKTHFNFIIKNNKFRKNKFFIHHNFFFLSSFDILIFYKKVKKYFFTRALHKKRKKKVLNNRFFFNFNTEQIFFDLYLKFISFVFKTGKKFFWENAFSVIFNNLSLNFSYCKSIILSKIFLRLFTRVELKKVRSRKRISFIPFFIKIKRSLFLALKWIFSSVLQNNNDISFKNKLYIELVQILTLKSCFSLKKLEENNLNSFNNRSNIHYRWDKIKI